MVQKKKTNPLDLRGSETKSVVAQARADGVLKGKYVKENDVDADKVVNAEEWLSKNKVETLSYETVKQLYPSKLSREALEKGTDLINEAILGIGEGLEEFLKENIVGLFDVMKENKTNSMKDYIDAVKFVTYKQAGDSVSRAYAKVFPDRIKRMQEEKIPNSYLHAYASSYSKNKIVTKIQAMLMIPSHIMYQDVFHQAVMVQTSIMTDDTVSPKVRSDAANSLMTHLKQPEIKQMELNVGIKESGVIQELANALGVLSTTQQEAMQNGKISMKDLREAVIIEVEPDE